jgi:hypothetical protein
MATRYWHPSSVQPQNLVGPSELSDQAVASYSVNYGKVTARRLKRQRLAYSLFSENQLIEMEDVW